jgi:hypothetical protein
VLYALCTLALIPSMALIDWTQLKPADFFSTPVIVSGVIQTIYSGVWVVLAGVWLVWFVVLHDWARARAIEVPSTLVAIAGALTCGVNFVHPLLTLLKLRRGTGLDTPLALWWWLSWGSVILASARIPSVVRGGYDALFIIASLMEVAAVLLCWKVARDFRLADQSWDPRAQLAARA